MRKFLFGALGTLCIIATAFIFVGMFTHPDKKPVEGMSEAEQFASNNNISVTLAESVENALLECEAPDSLKSLKDWVQIEDYADGKRYTAWSYSNKNERYYDMVFYVKDDVVVSIKDRDNALEVIWEGDEMNEIIQQSKDPNAVTIIASEIYENGEAYLDQYVYVTGKVTYISEYSDMNGYYLYGSMGKGLVCWVYNEISPCAKVGDEVKFYGYVRNLGADQVELTECELA